MTPKKASLVLALLAVAAGATFARDTVSPRSASGVAIENAMVDTRVEQTCLNNVLYYLIGVRDGYALAPKYALLRNADGSLVRDKNGQPVVKSSPEYCER